MADRLFVARVEITLGLSDALPLREMGLDPDPLTPLILPFQGLDDRYGDAATVAIDLRPLSYRRRKKQRERWRRWSSRQGSGKRAGDADLLSYIGRELQLDNAGPTVVDTVDRRVALGNAARKHQQDSLWELQILVRCVSEIEGRQINLVQGFVDAFAAYSGANYFRVVGLSDRFGLSFSGSDKPVYRDWFDFRLRTGLFWPRKQAIVARDEIQGLMKPPTVRCSAPNAPRAGGRIPKPPRDLPRYNRQPGVLPLGRVIDRRGAVRVGTYLKDFFFDYKSGKARYGKTELALVQIVHLATVERQGVFLMDPHSDGAARLRPYLVDHADRVIDLDLARRDINSRHVAWNLFSMQGASIENLPDYAQGIVDSFLVAARWQNATRALAIIGNVAESLLHLSLQFSQAGKNELSPTIWTIPRLLEDKDFQQAVSSRLPDALARYWVDTFAKYPAEAHGPVVNIISRLHRSATLRATLGSPCSTYRPREAIDTQAIVLACPGGGREKLVANFLVQAQIQAILSRRDTDPSKRLWVNNFFDEAQSYDSQTAGSLPELLEQCGKFRARVSVLNQTPDRLSAATLDALGTNSSALITTANSYDAATWFGKQWAGLVDAKMIVPRLDRYTYLAQVAHGAERTEPFLIHGDPLEEIYGQPASPQRVAELDAEVDRRYRPKTVAQTLEEIEGHNDKILNELSGVRTVKTADKAVSGSSPGRFSFGEGIS